MEILNEKEFSIELFQRPSACLVFGFNKKPGDFFRIASPLKSSIHLFETTKKSPDVSMQMKPAGKLNWSWK